MTTEDNGPCREMTLDEVVDQLPPKHTARDELEKLRAELVRRRNHFDMVGQQLEPFREKRYTGEPANSDRAEIMRLITRAANSGDATKPLGELRVWCVDWECPVPSLRDGYRAAQDLVGSILDGRTLAEIERVGS